jgi:hypothetical protein
MYTVRDRAMYRPRSVYSGRAERVNPGPSGRAAARPGGRESG